MQEELKEGLQKGVKKLLEDVHILILIIVTVSRGSKLNQILCFKCVQFVHYTLIKPFGKKKVWGELSVSIWNDVHDKQKQKFQNIMYSLTSDCKRTND